MANFQIDSLIIQEETISPRRYSLEAILNPGKAITDDLTPNPNSTQKELIVNITSSALSDNTVRIKCNSTSANSLDFTSYSSNRDYLLLLLEKNSSASDKEPVGFITVSDTDYPPPYKQRIKGAPTAYNHKLFSTIFSIKRAEFNRQTSNPHLFEVKFQINYNTSLGKYIPNKIRLEWDRARPGLEAIVIYVKSDAAGAPSPLYFPSAPGDKLLVQLDNYLFTGLPVIITEKDSLTEDDWADFETKKMLVYMDSLSDL